MKIIILGLFMSAQFAHASTFDSFMDGLKDDLFLLKTVRSKELASYVSVKPLGLFGRLLSPDGIATYNEKLNLISINKSLLQSGVNNSFAERTQSG